MCWPMAPGSDQAAPAQVQSMLDSWYTAQIRHSRHLSRWYQTHNHNNNESSHSTTKNHTNQPHRRRGIQLTLNDYLGYEETAAFGSLPGPINPDEMLCLVGCNLDGVNPFGNNAKLGTAVVRLKHLQSGSACLIETNVEWHKYEYRNTTRSVFLKTSGPQG
jgi:hypothetical protein